MSSPYINSPFLTLDNLDDTAENNNTVEKSKENKAEFDAGNSNQNAETSNKNRTDECIEEPIHSDEERVFLQKYQAVKEPTQPSRHLPAQS